MTDVSAVKLVVWDLDGTLIDSFGVYTAIIQEAAQISGLEVPTEAVMRHNFHGSLGQTIKDTFNMVDGELFDILLSDFLRVQEAYYSHPEEHVFADAKNLIQQLGRQGKTQVVATNREHAGRGSASPRYLVDNSSLSGYISELVCGDETQHRKPDPKVLATIAAAQALDGDEILVIGDQVVDAQLAQNVGCRVILVNRNDTPIPHLEKLGSDLAFLTEVSSLDDAELAYSIK